eukprot:scaffold5916_cov74-Skeletonema_dohrnii-CCMP3373.AAC.3
MIHDSTAKNLMGEYFRWSSLAARVQAAAIRPDATHRCIVLQAAVTRSTPPPYRYVIISTTRQQARGGDSPSPFPGVTGDVVP